MTHSAHSPLGTGTAIAAILALSTPPALAQDAPPSLDLPSSVVPAAPIAPPAVVLPDTAPPVATPQPRIVLPDVTQAPESSTTPRDAARADRPGAARPAQSNSTRSTANRSAPPLAPRQAAPAAQPADEVIDATPLAIQQEAASRQADAAASAQDVRPADPASRVGSGPATDDVPAGLLAGLAGALGLGLIGFLAMRRRRAGDEMESAAARLPVLDPPNALREQRVPTATLAMSEPVPAFSAGLPPRYDFLGMPVNHPSAAEPAPTSATQFVAPSEPAPAGEVRRALIERMVAAAPDSDNPFTSPRARRRRARMMLRKREMQAESQPAVHGEPFDWRTYRPSATSPSHPAMAEV